MKVIFVGSWSLCWFQINPWNGDKQLWIYESHIFELRIKKWIWKRSSQSSMSTLVYSEPWQLIRVSLLFSIVSLAWNMNRDAPLYAPMWFAKICTVSVLALPQDRQGWRGEDHPISTKGWRALSSYRRQKFRKYVDHGRIRSQFCQEVWWKLLL